MTCDNDHIALVRSTPNSSRRISATFYIGWTLPDIQQEVARDYQPTWLIRLRMISL
jgi:hypothetical protein